MIKEHKYFDKAIEETVVELSIPISNLGYIVGKGLTYEKALNELKCNFDSMFNPIKQAIDLGIKDNTTIKENNLNITELETQYIAAIGNTPIKDLNINQISIYLKHITQNFYNSNEKLKRKFKFSMLLSQMNKP